VALMLIMAALLALLAVFANVQRFRRARIETVVVRPVSSPASAPVR
jgi:hypothetical protein